MTSDLIYNNSLVIAGIIAFVVVFAIIAKRMDTENKKAELLELEEFRKTAVLRSKVYRQEILEIIEEIEEKALSGENLSGFTEKLDKLSPVYRTGSSEIDALLAHKADDCSRLGIGFDVIITSITDIDWSMMETISVIGNLIDNAIEAASLCGDAGDADADDTGAESGSGASAGSDPKPFIRARAKWTNDVWLLKVVNSKSSNVKPIENKFATTKSDFSKHGIGLGLVKQIVKKYGGEIRFRDKGETFEVLITIWGNKNV